jgi:hypothetical protein
MDGRKDLRELVQGFRRAIRFLMAPIVVLSLAGCADLRGIQAFGKMAPDAATIQGLTKIYVQEPGVREDIKLLGDSAPNPELEQNGPIRAQEAHAIQAIDGSLRAYMQSLAALAGDDIVQSSSSVKGVTTGLTSLSKSIPALGITGDQITAIGHFIQSVADLIESGYRNAELVKIIRDNDKELHLLLSVQSTIVSRGIKPSILEIQRSLNESAAAAAIKYIDQDLGHWTVTPGANAPAANSSAAKLFNDRNPTYQGQGEADAHAARYLLKISFEEEQATLATQLATADAYIKALDAIGRAHEKLVANGKDVLKKQMVQQIQPLANEVHQDFQDIEAQAALPAKH